MSQIERNIDAMKYRKSDYLAGVDVEAIINEKGNCIVTIADAYYARGVQVANQKTDGYIIKFQEDIKPMVVNSGNRKIISDIVKTTKNLKPVDARNIGNWPETKIELYFDENVKFAGKLVGGIRVKAASTIPDISDENAIKLLESSKDLEELAANWQKLSAKEKKLPTVLALKNELKTQLG